MNLPKPKIYQSNVIKTKKGKRTIDEHRYNLKDLNISTSDLDKLVRKELKDKVKKNGPMLVTVSYWIDKEYSTNFVQVNNSQDIDNMKPKNEYMIDYDQDLFDDDNDTVKFLSLFTVPVKAKVGESEKNDCLPDALRQAFFDPPAILKTNEAFKAFCGTERYDKIDLTLLPKIEKALQMNIICCGQYEYTNSKRYPRSIKIRVYNDHVDHVYAMGHWKELTQGYNKKKIVKMSPLYFKKNLETQTVKLCRLMHGNQGDKIITVEPLSYLTDFHKSKLKYRYFLVEVEPREQPEDVIEREIKLRKRFNDKAYKYIGSSMAGCLNPFHARFKWNKMASHYWYKHAPKSISQCDPFDVDEDVWISKAMTGGLLYAEKETRIENAFEYDINSMYPALMCVTDFITRQGTYKTLTEMPTLSKSDQYTIFRAKVTNFDSRLFQPSKHGYYCALDLLTAQQEGYTINLIMDGLPNCIVYDKNSRIPGEEVFKKFINEKSQRCKSCVELSLGLPCFQEYTQCLDS